jgi:biopolymer transport protein ExbB/TolQ
MIMKLPYTPAEHLDSDVSKIIRAKDFFGSATWVCGAGIVLGPIIGLVGTVKGMVQAFGTLEKTGTAEPSVLAGDISMVLLANFWGLVFSVILLIPFTVFLVLFLKQERLLRKIKTTTELS